MNMEKRFNKKKLLLLLGCLALVLSMVMLIYLLFLPMYYYTQGINSIANESYEEAIAFFEKAGEYKDSGKYIEHSKFERGKQLYGEKDLEGALGFFSKTTDIEEINEWLEKTGIAFLDAGRYEEAYDAFVLIPEIKDEKNKWYAAAMTLFEDGEYEEAIRNFEKCIDTRNASEKIIQAHYFYGKVLFEEENYSKSYDEFQKCISYDDSKQLSNDCLFMMGEQKWNDGKYEDAKTYYLELPGDYMFENDRVSDRLKSISIYDSVKKLEGYYKVAKGDYRVTQTHNSTGIYHYWYNTSTGFGNFDIDIQINKDGTVNVSGEAEGTRYTTYSSIASGVKTGKYYAGFNKTITSTGLPKGVLYSDNNITLKYDGGTTFKLSYNEVDRSQDVYFRYTYTSDYTFVKESY